MIDNRVRVRESIVLAEFPDIARSRPLYGIRVCNAKTLHVSPAIPKCETRGFAYQRSNQPSMAIESPQRGKRLRR